MLLDVIAGNLRDQRIYSFIQFSDQYIDRPQAPEQNRQVNHIKSHITDQVPEGADRFHHRHSGELTGTVCISHINNHSVELLQRSVQRM